MTDPTVAVPEFMPFYLNRIPRQTVAERLLDRIVQVATPEHAEELTDRVWEDLVHTVERHSLRVLIGEFHEFRERQGLPMSGESDEALQKFRQHLNDPDSSRDILTRYEVLCRRLTVVLNHLLDAYDELFVAYLDDRPALAAYGLLADEGDTLAGLFNTEGDSHNDNRRVIGLCLAGGGKLIFKPRTLVADKLVRDLYEAAEPYLAHTLDGCVATSLTVRDHGWQRFVTPRAMTTADQPARYFYRFGALCALFSAIGSTDLHDENLLACGEYPCVIDTEMVLRPGVSAGDDSLERRLAHHVEHSVASTMLVPNVRPDSPFDVIMAGVGVGSEQVSGKLKRIVIQDGGTDAVRLIWKPVVYRHKDNVPRLGEEELASVRYFGDIVAGYTDALRVVRQGDTIERVLGRYADLPVRCLVRSTVVYGRFLDAATQPRYLRDTGMTKHLFGLLEQYPRHLSSATRAFVGEAERTALDSGNVPYFTARADSTELATGTSRHAGAYRSSPADHARRGIALSAGQSDVYHRFVLEECFGELAATAPDVMSARSVFAPVFDGAADDAWWPRVARTIQDARVSHQGEQGPESGWIGGVGADRGAPTLVPGSYPSFHDTGGIVTFLRDAAQRDPGLREAYLSADRGLSALLKVYGDVLLGAPESVFTGGASLLLTRPFQQDRAWVARLLEAIAERGEAGTLETDLASGPAGFLMAVLARAEAGQGALVDADQLTGLCDLVLGQAKTTRDRVWFDVAHGDLGMQWAVSRIGGHTGEVGLTDAAADWLTERLADGAPPPVPGWCNGSAGLLLVAVDILAAAGRLETLTGRLLADLVDRTMLLPPQGPVDLSVCHGAAGVIQSLIAVSRVLEDRSLLDRAAGYRRSVSTAARRNGFHTGCPGRTSLLGYMLGWSGIGHTDLLLSSALDGTGTAFVPVALTAPVAPGVPSPRVPRPRSATVVPQVHR